MEPFSYIKATDEAKAVAASAKSSQYIAGGTNLVDYMRLAVINPATVVDINGLSLAAIEETPTGVKIGALARNADVAYHPLILGKYAVLSEAILAGASPQIRNAASTGGNLLQRTRCPYYRDATEPACNKRAPDSGCAAIGGFTRSHAVLGTSAKCIASHPSDQNTALAILDAIVHIQGAQGPRTIPFEGLHTLPGDHPELETTLAPGELITHVELRAAPAKSHYVKVRDRASFAFALASAAVAIDVEAGRIKDARVGLGGIATKPWRSKEAEQILVGQPATPEVFKKAADAALAGAHTQPDNAFKVELAKRTLVRALTEVTAGGAR